MMRSRSARGVTQAQSSRVRKNLFLIKIFPHFAVKTGFFPIVLSRLRGRLERGEAGCEDFFSSLLAHSLVFAADPDLIFDTSRWVISGEGTVAHFGPRLNDRAIQAWNLSARL